MPNIRSAVKRVRQAEKRRERNRVYQGAARTAVKKARTLMESGDEGAAEAVRIAAQALDKAAAKGTIHPNNAARRKSRLMAQLHKLQSGE